MKIIVFCTVVFLGLSSPVFSIKRNLTLQEKSAISGEQSALKNTKIRKNRSEPPEKKNKIEETEASVVLRSCLQKIYEKLKPLNKTLRAYATERPDKKPWEIGSYGPAYLRHWATCLEVVQDDIGNNLCLSLLGNSDLSALTYLSNEDVAGRLKKCIEGFESTLIENDLPSHQAEFVTLFELANQLIEKTTKAAQDEFRSVSKIEEIFDNEKE